MSDEEIEKTLGGLRGWLILIGIGIVVGPFRSIITLIPLYEGIFEGDVWNNLTTPGTSAYHPFWSTSRARRPRW